MKRTNFSIYKNELKVVLSTIVKQVPLMVTIALSTPNPLNLDKIHHFPLCVLLFKRLIGNARIRKNKDFLLDIR
jgi:hypothetical protein